MTTTKSPEQLRDEALARVARNADPAWWAAAVTAVYDLAMTQRTFTTDDIWQRLDGTSATHEPRALGAVVKTSVALGMMTATDRHRPSQRPENHARPVRVWRSALLDPVDVPASLTTDLLSHALVRYAGACATAEAAGSPITEVPIEFRDLRGESLAGLDLRGIQLPGVDLLGADLRGSDLRGARLDGALMHETNLRGADLRGASLREAHLLGADLRGAVLSEPEWPCRSQQAADLTGALIDWLRPGVPGHLLRVALESQDEWTAEQEAAVEWVEAHGIPPCNHPGEMPGDGEWVADVLAPWARDDVGSPPWLHRWANAPEVTR